MGIKHKYNAYSLAMGLEVGVDDLAEQAAQEPREHQRWAVVAAAAFCSSLRALERRHRVEHDAQLVFPGDLLRGLADAEQLAKTGSAIAREELESAHGQRARTMRCGGSEGK